MEKVPEGRAVPKDLMTTVVMKKMRKMKDRGNEDVNAEGGSPGAQTEATRAVALMDPEILPITDRAPPPGDVERLPLSGIRFRKS